MPDMVNYLLESGVSLAFLSLIFLIFLRKETFFRTNRLFLLASIGFSLILPLFHFSVLPNEPALLPEVTVTPYKNLLETVIVTGKGFTSTIETAVASSTIVIILYLAGVTAASALFLIRLLKLRQIAHSGRVVPLKNGKMVLVQGDIVPFSFLNYLFLPENYREMPGYERIVSHEREHISQGHTYDVLLCELLLIIQWFNPFAWLLRREVRENHEYLADRGVLRSGVLPGEYKMLLLSQVTGPQFSVANHFNFSLLKSRMRMISRIPSSRASLTKILTGLLAGGLLVMAFACEKKEHYVPESAGEVKTAEVRMEEIFRIVDIMPQFPGGETALRQFIASNVDYPETARVNGIQGKVYLSFTVGKDGRVKDIKVIRSVDPSLDQEAQRVLQSMPLWEPGIHQGKPASVEYTIPVNFVLQ